MTKGETAIRALRTVLGTALSLTVLRDDVLARDIPAGGSAGIEPGDPVELGRRLGPEIIEWQHDVTLTLVVQDHDATAGAAALDALLALAGAALDTNRTLGGAVDYLEIGAPETASEGVEGADAIRGASVVLSLYYETGANPLFSPPPPEE